MYLLDTDIVSLHQWGDEDVKARIGKIPASELFISSVTLAEQMRGCWNAVHKAKEPMKLIWAYELCGDIVEYYSFRRLASFDQEASQIYRDLITQGVRIGTNDLRIAATALSHGADLITRNVRDFEKVPSLNVIDWRLPDTR